MLNNNPLRRNLVSTAIVGVTFVATGLVIGVRPAAATPGPSTTPSLSSTIIMSDSRSIALRQWFSPVDVGLATEANRSFTWTAPSTTDAVDVVVIGGGGGGGGGKAGNHGNATSPNVRGAGGGGGGGGEVRRDTATSVTPGETLSLQVGAGGVGGAGAVRGNVDPAPAAAGGDGNPSFLKRANSSVIVQATGGHGGKGGANSGGGTVSSGGAAGAGATGGSGGTLLTTGINGTAGSNSTSAPSAAGALNNSGSGWLYNGLRLGGGGGGGGGKSSNGGSTNTISAGTTATTGSIHDLTNLGATITRIGGDGDGGNNQYVSNTTKNAPTRLGGGGGGGAFVFSAGRAAGRGGSGVIAMTYVVADLIVSELTPASSAIPASTGSTTVTLQLRNAAGTATNVSVGPIEMSTSGTDSTLGSVTDNGNGTYSVTLTAGSAFGTATVTAHVVGSNFTDTADVTIQDPSVTTTTAAGATTTTIAAMTTPPGKPGEPTVTPVPGGLEVTVEPPTTGGTPTSYTATAQPGGATCTVTGATGSCTISGLSNSTDYTVTVVASNSGGDSPPSDESGHRTPLRGESDLGGTGIDMGWHLGLGLALLVAGLLMSGKSSRPRRPATARQQ